MGQAQRLAVADHYRQGHFIGPSLAESPPSRPSERQLIAVSLAMGDWKQAQAGPAP